MFLLGSSRIKAAALGGILFLGTAGPTSAATVLLQQGVNGYVGTSDTTIFEELPENSAGGFPWVFAGMTQFSDPRRALLKFDLTGAVPPGSTITDVTLLLYMDRTRPGDVACELRRLTRSWNEGSNPLPPLVEGGTGAPAQNGDTTWNHVSYNTVQWAAAGGEFAATSSGTGIAGNTGTFLTLTGSGMATDVQNWLTDPSSNHGWILLAGETGAWNAKRFISSESTDTQKPQLQITYNSEPAAVVGWELFE